MYFRYFYVEYILDVSSRNSLDVSSAMLTKDVKLKFSGHETFPLRHGWLLKAVTYIHENGKIRTSNDEDLQNAVVSMGVGKNMVSSIRYWCEISRVIRDDRLTQFADLLFGNSTIEGVDRYLEAPSSMWLLHWAINSNKAELTTSRWFFNHYNGQRFDKNSLIKALERDLSLTDVRVPARKTLEKDVDCFLQTYTTKNFEGKVSEDSFASPLSELELVFQGSGKVYRSDLADRDSLTDEVLLYCLDEFFRSNPQSGGYFAFDKLLTMSGSPARVFRLSERALSERIERISGTYKGTITWTDTQGLRAVQFNFDHDEDIFSLLNMKIKTEVSS